MTAGSTDYPRTRRRRPRALRCSGHGFTLVEMLVVIGLIVVLVAMLMPAVAGTRQKAAAAACASNERQIYQASVAFALDHAGRLPVPSWVQENVENTTPEFQRDACWVNIKTNPPDPPGGQIDFTVGG